MIRINPLERLTDAIIEQAALKAIGLGNLDSWYTEGSYAPEDCSPTDSACVQRNTARSIIRQYARRNEQAVQSKINCERDEARNKGRFDLACERYDPIRVPTWEEGLEIAVGRMNFPSVKELEAQKLVEALAAGTAPDPWRYAEDLEYRAAVDAAEAQAAGTPQPTARIDNITRPGQDFQVGDYFNLQIHGSPNHWVSVHATHDGISSQADFGQTDSQGNWRLSEPMASGSVGNWSETWYVGGIQATPTLYFTVRSRQAAQEQPPAQEQQPAQQQPPAQEQQPAQQQPPLQETPPEEVASPAKLELPTWLSGQPWWVYALAGGGLLFFLKGK